MLLTATQAGSKVQPQKQYVSTQPNSSYFITIITITSLFVFLNTTLDLST